MEHKRANNMDFEATEDKMNKALERLRQELVSLRIGLTCIKLYTVVIILYKVQLVNT